MMKNLRKHVCLALLAAMLLGLCACGASPAEPTPTATAAPATAEPTAAPTPETVATARPTVPGYIASEIPNPDWVERFYTADVYGDKFYLQTKTTDGMPAVAVFDTLTDTFSRIDINLDGLHNPVIGEISAAENTLWLFVYETETLEEIQNSSYPDELGIYLVCVNLDTGEQMCSIIRWKNTNGEAPAYLLALDNDRALTGNDLNESDPIALIDRSANVIGVPETILRGNVGRVRVNGELWLQSDAGLAPYDTVALQFTGTPVPELSNQPYLYSSNCGRILVTRDNVLYAYDPAAREETEIFKWADVALSSKRICGIHGLENSNGDIYHLTDRITKISMGEVPVKDTLTLACLGDTTSDGYPVNGGYFGSTNRTYVYSDTLMDAIFRFNNSDPDYRVEIKPYIYSSEEERTRLLIDLATGGEVDLIDTSLLPDGAADSSMLVDLLPYLDVDAGISREDFIPGILSAMMRNGGLYEYIDRFDILTVTTRQSFAEGGEWTAERMCQLAMQNPELRIENNAENLVLLFSRVATAEFMDTANAECRFTDPAFTEWLKLLKALCTSDSPDWRTEEYTFYIDYDFPTHIGDNSRRFAGGEYSVVGFPNVENGSYLMRYGTPTARGYGSIIADGMMTVGADTSIGIMASSQHRDGAWRFVKTYMSGAEDVDLLYGIPANKASFERAVTNALAKEQDERDRYPRFTESDAEYIRSIVYNTTKCVINSPEVMDTMRTVLNAYLGGQYTEEAASAQLQSRLSIYLAEKYG